MRNNKIDVASAISMRESGSTYSEIAVSLKCSISWCKANLKQINCDKSNKPLADSLKYSNILWRSVMSRESKRVQSKAPSYIGVRIHEDFRDYQKFDVWCSSQKGFDVVGFDLDKDLLSSGEFMYGPNNCTFLPHIINMLIIQPREPSKELPRGVYLDKDRNTYVARLSMNDKQVFLGRYESPDEAFTAYKWFKEAVIKQEAYRWKDKIENRAFEALLSFEVKP